MQRCWIQKYDGRIDGYDGEWKLIDTINIKDKITLPTIVGCIDECNVIITDRVLGRLHTYMLDMKTKISQRVITGIDTSWVASCALLNDGKVVCSKTCEGVQRQFERGYIVFMTDNGSISMTSQYQETPRFLSHG